MKTPPQGKLLPIPNSAFFRISLSVFSFPQTETKGRQVRVLFFDNTRTHGIHHRAALRPPRPSDTARLRDQRL